MTTNASLFLHKIKKDKAAHKKLLAETKGKRDSIKPKVDVKKSGDKKTDVFKHR